MKIETANRILKKVGTEIRRASTSETKDALFSGVANPRWVIDSGVFRPKQVFGSVSEAFRYVCKNLFAELERAALTEKQKEIVRMAVYE